MGVGPLLKFNCIQLRRFRPILFLALISSSALLALSTGNYFVNHKELAVAQHAVVLHDVSLQMSAKSQTAVKPLTLPKFDSAVLVSAIEQASASMKVSTDELTFALEDGTSQPYRRYRASFSMLGRYPQIRATITRILRDVPYSVLDSIKCFRDDISEADVSCTVNMSAFYKRPSSP